MCHSFIDQIFRISILTRDSSLSAAHCSQRQPGKGNHSQDGSRSVRRGVPGGPGCHGASGPRGLGRNLGRAHPWREDKRAVPPHPDGELRAHVRGHRGPCQCALRRRAVRHSLHRQDVWRQPLGVDTARRMRDLRCVPVDEGSHQAGPRSGVVEREEARGDGRCESDSRVRRVAEHGPWSDLGPDQPGYVCRCC